MATVKRFEDLIIWQLARQLAKEVFELSTPEKFRNDFDLIRQIRRSSGSVMDNIAEGFDREGNAEFKQFLSMQRDHLAKPSHKSIKHMIENIFPKTYSKIK